MKYQAIIEYDWCGTRSGHRLWDKKASRSAYRDYEDRSYADEVNSVRIAVIVNR